MRTTIQWKHKINFNKSTCIRRIYWCNFEWISNCWNVKPENYIQLSNRTADRWRAHFVNMYLCDRVCLQNWKYHNKIIQCKLRTKCHLKWCTHNDHGVMYILLFTIDEHAIKFSSRIIIYECRTNVNTNMLAMHYVWCLINDKRKKVTHFGQNRFSATSVNVCSV